MVPDVAKSPEMVKPDEYDDVIFCVLLLQYQMKQSQILVLSMQCVFGLVVYNDYNIADDVEFILLIDNDELVDKLFKLLNIGVDGALNFQSIMLNSLINYLNY